jgi:hypothetical protein
MFDRVGSRFMTAGIYGLILVGFVSLAAGYITSTMTHPVVVSFEERWPPKSIATLDQETSKLLSDRYKV